MADDEVYDILFPSRNSHKPAYSQPNWERVHRKLAKAGVTLKLLHREYADRRSEERVSVRLN